MRRLAGTALICSSAFVAIVALLSDAPALFYIGTALLATIGTARLQAYLSVRGLAISRFVPKVAHVGEIVKVEIVVKSERNIRRPLIYLRDGLPPRLLVAERTPSLPIAPDFKYPARTEYSFKPRRRGVFRWSSVEAIGTDALGLVTMTRSYSTESVELKILPVPIPAQIDLPSATGWGVSEASSGDQKGPGGEPRGIREYKSGDSLRHVHWRSSARTGTLQVKEFEAGSHSRAVIFLQRTAGTDLLSETDARGDGPVFSSLDLMVGHALHLAENMVRQGAQVVLPQLEDTDVAPGPDRMAEIALLLAGVQASGQTTLSDELHEFESSQPQGCLALVMMTVVEAGVLEAIRVMRAKDIQIVALLYDASAFVDKRDRRVMPQSASSANFIESLRLAGAYPITMPAFRGDR